MQADRVLRDMHKLCCHDLPNQIVVARTLLHFLEEDDADRLSADGREYVKRLTSTLNAAGDMARVLREFVNLSAFESQPGEIKLDQLARDWRAKIAERFTGYSIKVKYNLSESTAKGDARALGHAVLEFLALALASEAENVDVVLLSEDHGERVGITFAVTQSSAKVPLAIELRCEWLLVRNWLEAAGAELDRVVMTTDQASLKIKLPRR